MNTRRLWSAVKFLGLVVGILAVLFGVTIGPGFVAVGFDPHEDFPMWANLWAGGSMVVLILVFAYVMDPFGD